MTPVSVLMSVYNEPLDWLKSSIESILSQSFTDFEFIIVNDNPGRREIGNLLNHYSTIDERVRIIENDKNLGLTKSLNKAIKIAKGKYIARMDADDIAMSDRFEHQYQFMESNHDVFIVGTSVQLIDAFGKGQGKVFKALKHNKIIKQMLSGNSGIYHPTIMFRNENSQYREKFKVAQDFDFYLMLLSQGKKFANLGHVLLQYRVTDRNISRSNRKKQILYKKLAIKFYNEKLFTGYDSYDKIDINNETKIIEFLDIDVKALKAEMYKEIIVFALKGQNFSRARRAFKIYSKYSINTGQKWALWFFITVPCFYSIYRKLRYQTLLA